MPKTWSKYKALKAEYEEVKRDLGRRREMIEQLRKEKESAYYDGYKQGIYDAKMAALDSGKVYH